MRGEKEMLDLILCVAERDDNIRAVIMNGSRLNPPAKKDPFQDYDIVYFVRDVEPYKRNPTFIKPFGEPMILQTPEDMFDPPSANDGHYSYLMQLLDGTRIDLSLFSLENIPVRTADSLTVVLLDKDLLIPDLPPPTDRDYLPQEATAKQFDDCCNEFWWMSVYVAKGLWRDELTYTKQMLDVYVRDELMKMLVWYFGVQTGFQQSPGKLGKYFKGYHYSQWEICSGIRVRRWPNTSASPIPSRMTKMSPRTCTTSETCPEPRRSSTSSKFEGDQF